MKTSQAPENMWRRGHRQCWWKDNQGPPRDRRHWWRSGLVVWLMLSVCGVPVLSSAPASPAHKRLAQQKVPAGSPSPALPVSVSERFLNLSLEQAVQLALQNNLDIERGRLDPQVQH